jgi:hypothetical protein
MAFTVRGVKSHLEGGTNPERGCEPEAGSAEDPAGGGRAAPASEEAGASPTCAFGTPYWMKRA